MDKRKFRGLIGVLLIIIFTLSLLLISESAWATPQQDHLRQTVPSPTPTPFILPPSCPPPVGCVVFDWFTLEGYLGRAVTYPAYFDPPLEICVPFTQEQADANGGIENLTIAYWDDFMQAWIGLDNTRYDPTAMVICGDLSYMPESICGLGLTCTFSPPDVPTTGSEGWGELNPAIAGLALAGALVLILGLFARRRASLG